jgi:hypothetical protein
MEVIDLAGSGNDDDDGGGVMDLDGEYDESEVAAKTAQDMTNRLTSARKSSVGHDQLVDRVGRPWGCPWAGPRRWEGWDEAEATVRTRS